MSSIQFRIIKEGKIKCTVLFDRVSIFGSSESFHQFHKFLLGLRENNLVVVTPFELSRLRYLSELK